MKPPSLAVSEDSSQEYWTAHSTRNVPRPLDEYQAKHIVQTGYGVHVPATHARLNVQRLWVPWDFASHKLDPFDPSNSPNPPGSLISASTGISKLTLPGTPYFSHHLPLALLAAAISPNPPTLVFLSSQSPSLPGSGSGSGSHTHIPHALFLFMPGEP